LQPSSTFGEASVKVIFVTFTCRTSANALKSRGDKEMPDGVQRGRHFAGDQSIMRSRIKSVSKASKRPTVEFDVTDEDLDRVSGGAGGASGRVLSTASGITSGMSGRFNGASGSSVEAPSGFVGASGKQ
jgi:hypothetical protein